MYDSSPDRVIFITTREFYAGDRNYFTPANFHGEISKPWQDCSTLMIQWDVSEL